MIKKLFCAALSCLLLFTVTDVSNFHIKAAQTNDFAKADTIKLNTTYQMPIDNDYDNIMKFTVPSKGKVTLRFNSVFDAGKKIADLEFAVYDGNQNKIKEFKDSKISTAYVYPVGLNAGTYYVRVRNNYNGIEDKSVAYQIQYTASNNYEIEPNNTLNTATPLAINQKMTGDMNGVGDDFDSYKVNTSRSMRVRMMITNLERVSVQVEQLNTKATEYNVNDFKKGSSCLYVDLTLPKGTSYITLMERMYGAGNYQLQLSEITLNLNKSNLALYTGHSATITAKSSIKDVISWSSSNTKVATVNSKGVVTAKGVGTARITASVGGVKKTCTVSVKNPTLTLNKKNTTMYRGTSMSIKATVKPTASVKWTSSNKKVASVDSKGKVKALKTGSATITASVGKVKKSIRVTVKEVTKLSTPAKPTAVAQGVAKLKLSWKPVSYVSGYQVYRSTNAKKGFKKIATTSKTSITNGVSVNKTYYYKVRGYRKNGKKTIYSKYSKVVGKKAALAKPTFSKISSPSYTSVKLQWKKVPYASGYEITRSTNAKKGFKKIATLKKGTTITYTNTKLTTNKTYYYKVRAYQTVGKKKVYSAYATVKSGKATRQKPSYVAAVLSQDGLVGLGVYNAGRSTIRVYSEGAKVLNLDYPSKNRSLMMVKEKNNTVVKVNYMDVKPKQTVGIVYYTPYSINFKNRLKFVYKIRYEGAYYTGYQTNY